VSNMPIVTPADEDLNKVIASAVNARVEAAVMSALAGDETIGRMVTAALRQAVEVPDPDRQYGKIRVPFLNHLIQTAMREATKRAVEKVLIEEAEAIEDECRKAIKRQAAGIAATLAGQLQDAAAKSYGVSVTLKYPGV
jgi:hypothetical protein